MANDANCDDILYCNGTETCDALLDCQPGTAVDCDDGVGCTNDSCNEGTDSCDHVVNDVLCDDSLYCNGTETCDALLDCLAGTDPCTEPDLSFCDEANDECVAGAAAITKTQLAGNSLGDYPFFEYVRAFNEDATVEVAIDPTRFPEIVGLTCDIYVVQAKTGGEWLVDPSLTDVLGGPLTATLGGTTIQDNTFTVAGPFDLDADAGIGLGVGYDVVLDCGQDGLLGDGDYIDGLSTEAGLYVVRDTTQPGPLAVTEIIYSGGSWLDQDTYYPTDIASMGELPLVVVSHGNGHLYTWYDHIGYHLASYGYIVMSHENNTGPGSEAASTTTLTNTDYIIGNQDVIQGGVLNGHIDSSRITWIGHSRGGEGVVRAHTRLRTGGFVPDHYDIDDIVLVSSMAPVTHISPASASTPYDVNYHLFQGAADSDVSGSAGSSNSKPLAFYDRAFGNKQLIYIHGCGHAWLHDGPESPSWAEGPDQIGQAAAHQVVKGYFLPLVELYVKNNLVGRDYFARLYEHFRPPGIPGNVICANYYRDAEAVGNFVIDDYQTETGTGTSSSGGAVTFNVENLDEVLMRDQDGSFAWTGSQPSNGMTMYRWSDDDPHCAVFDWPTGSQKYYELEVIPAQRVFSDDTFLSFRACQGTHHPRTDALNSPLSFTVTLRDTSGTSSSIDFGSYGRITRTYLRSGGWANEFSTVRIRLTDFLANGSGLDLSDVEAVRFDFGSAFGSEQGRIGVDDIELTWDYPPIFVPLTMTVPGGPPEFLSPGVPTTIDVEILEGSDTMVPDSAQLHYRYGGGEFVTTPLMLVGELYQGTLAAAQCEDTPEFYFSVEGSVTGVVYQPPGAPSGTFTAFVGERVVILEDDFETDLGWTVEDDPSLTSGSWDRGVPADDGLEGDPTVDFDGSGQCYLTGNWAGNSDVDGGPTRLISPTMDLSTAVDPILRYARWWANDDQDGDPMDIEISNDNGASWVTVETVANVPPTWVERTVYIAEVIDPLPLTSQMKVRISAMDVPNNSKDEGGFDAFEVFDVQCE